MRGISLKEAAIDLLKVALLGGVRVTHNDWLCGVQLTRELQALLAYLLLHRHRVHSRDVLADVFWRERSHQRARRALNTALWRLRKVLEPEGIPAGTYLLSTHSGEVGFNRESRYWLDVEIFEQEVNRVIANPSETVNGSNIHELEKTLRLYHSELLEEIYEDWAFKERERLHAIYLKSLMYLMQYYTSQGKYEKASTYGQQILNLEPIREDIHRQMMRLFLETGQRALAARQYERCRSTLAKELGILPMEETQMLYLQIFPETQKNGIADSSQEPLDFDQMLAQLRQLSQTIELVRKQVQQILQFFTKYARPED